MPQRTLDKTAGSYLLDAVKNLLDVIGRQRLEMTQSGGSASRELTAVYGELRHIRDHLRRATDGFGEEAEIDLSARDADLVACALLWETAAVSEELQSGFLPGDEAEWAVERRAVCMRYAVELASQPVIRLIPNVSADHLQRCPEVLQVSAAIRHKLNPASAGGGLIDRDGAADGNSVVGAVEKALTCAHTSDLLQLDVSHLHHPRLRSLLAIELPALKRSMGAGDFRTATLHLAAVFEIVVLDRAMPAKERLGLRDDPELWDLKEILAALLGRDLTEREQAIVSYLLSAADLMRPAVQLNRPVVANKRSFLQCFGLAESILVALGVMEAAAASAPTASPAPQGRATVGRVRRERPAPPEAGRPTPPWLG